MPALALCTLNARRLFREVIDKIETEYLLGQTELPTECKDGTVSTLFYRYIIAARYENVLAIESFQKAYADHDFLEYFCRSLPMWVSKENFDAEEWIIPCWNYVKTSCAPDQCQKLAYLLLHSIDDVKPSTESLLDMYIDIASYCFNKHSLHIEPSKLTSIFDINKSKGHILLQKLPSLLIYIDVEELKQVICTYQKYSLQPEARELLNTLANNGEISNKQREQLATLLD